MKEIRKKKKGKEMGKKKVKIEKKWLHVKKRGKEGKVNLKLVYSSYVIMVYEFEARTIGTHRIIGSLIIQFLS